MLMWFTISDKTKHFKLNIIFLFDIDNCLGIWGYITCYKWCIFWLVLKFYYIFVPEIHSSAGIRIIQFFDQKYPNLTETFWTAQTEDLIQIQTKIGFCDLIRIQNPFFSFEQPIFKIWSNLMTKIRSDYFWTTGPCWFEKKA